MMRPIAAVLSIAALITYVWGADAMITALVRVLANTQYVNDDY